MAFALRDPAVPGIYMDAVNPDYLAAWMLRGDLTMPAWIYPDNYLAGEYKYPLLNSLYGGNIPAYLGLAFFSVAGFGLEQLRLFHALFGAVLLLTMYWGLRQWQTGRWVTLFAVSLLATDPNFVFAWRTQFYLQLVPAIFLFAAIGLLGRDYIDGLNGTARKWRLWLAGICLGFAAYCYFIYAFHALAAVVVYALSTRRRAGLARVAVPLVVGTLIGWLPYVYAHLSIVLNLDFHRYVEMIKGLQSTYGVIDSGQTGLGGRLHAVPERFARLFGANGTRAQIMGQSAAPALLNRLHGALLLIGPVVALACLVARRGAAGDSVAQPQGPGPIRTQAMAAQRMLLGLVLALLAGHLVLAIVVGRPLGLQHYYPFLPVVYASLAGAIAVIAANGAGIRNQRPAWRAALLAVGSGALVLNLALSSSFMRALSAHGGAGMYTDAINVAAEELTRRGGDQVVLFPQWGYWMGAVALMGPRSHVVESPSLQQLAQQMGADPLLKAHRSFVLVVGKETAGGSEDEIRSALADFAQSSGLVLGEIKRCAARNGGEPLWLVEARRS